MRIEDRWNAVVTSIQFHLAALILGVNQKSHDLWEQKCDWLKFDKETETSEVLLTLSCKGQESGSCVLLTPAIECRSILAIDTSIDPRSTLDRHLGRPSLGPRLTHGRHLGRQTFNFR